MPAVSEAQRAYLNAKFGHAWVKAHHFSNRGKLPARVRKTRRPTPVATSLSRGGKR